jgi:hypothetical protein
VTVAGAGPPPRQDRHASSLSWGARRRPGRGTGSSLGRNMAVLDQGSICREMREANACTRDV